MTNNMLSIVPKKAAKGNLSFSVVAKTATFAKKFSENKIIVMMTYKVVTISYPSFK
jgi:hypothetical protein